MYRLIIADDEFAIRSGLARMIPWNDLGFELTGRFEDGKEVIAYVEQHDVDVIFSDVKMFEVSGLDVAKWIAQNKPEVTVILLSGYKEFDYVKEALVTNVFDYILKPINPEEIVRVFQKVKEKLDKEYKDTNKLPILNIEQPRELLSIENTIERAKAYIQKHISEDLSVEKIAESCYLSRSHFAREFKRCTGDSVMDYVIQKRMELAVSLMKQGEKSQKKIASSVGYSDLKYFQRSFKKHTGCTVKEYQRLLYH